MTFAITLPILFCFVLFLFVFCLFCFWCLKGDLDGSTACPCFPLLRQNVIVIVRLCKILSFLCSLKGFFCKNVNVFAFLNQISKWRVHLERVICYKVQKVFSTCLKHPFCLSYLPFCLPNFAKIANSPCMVSLWC